MLHGGGCGPSVGGPRLLGERPQALGGCPRPLGATGLTVQLGSGIQISKIDLVIFYSSTFLTSAYSCLTQECCTNTNSMVVVCFKATTNMLNEKPCNLVVDFRRDLPRGPDWLQKRCRALPMPQSSLPTEARFIQGFYFY